MAEPVRDPGFQLFAKEMDADSMDTHLRWIALDDEKQDEFRKLAGMEGVTEFANDMIFIVCACRTKHQQKKKK